MSERDDSSIATRIQNWLTEEGLQNNRIDDPQADANISYWSDPQLKMHGLVFKNKVTIVLSVLFRPESMSIVHTSKDRQEQFFKNLNLELYHQPCDFYQQFDKDTKEVVGLRIEKRIWEESLTRTSFFDATVLVTHCGYIFAINEQELIAKVGT